MARGEGRRIHADEVQGTTEQKLAAVTCAQCKEALAQRLERERRREAKKAVPR
jgi:hypothetical protein